MSEHATASHEFRRRIVFSVAIQAVERRAFTEHHRFKGIVKRQIDHRHVNGRIGDALFQSRHNVLAIAEYSAKRDIVNVMLADAEVRTAEEREGKVPLPIDLIGLLNLDLSNRVARRAFREACREGGRERCRDGGATVGRQE